MMVRGPTTGNGGVWIGNVSHGSTTGNMGMWVGNVSHVSTKAPILPDDRRFFVLGEGRMCKCCGRPLQNAPSGPGVCPCALPALGLCVPRIVGPADAIAATKRTHGHHHLPTRPKPANVQAERVRETVVQSFTIVSCWSSLSCCVYPCPLAHAIPPADRSCATHHPRLTGHELTSVPATALTFDRCA